MQTKKTEIWVGVFLLVALLAALFVCLKAANVTSLRTEPTYRLYATFDNIGGLKARSPSKPAGRKTSTRISTIKAKISW